MANSILDAQQRLRGELPHFEEFPRKGPRTYNKREVLTPPQFQSANFEATIFKLQSNAAGEWMLTLKVPPEYREQATSLGDSYGLSLMVNVNRKRYDPDGDT